MIELDEEKKELVKVKIIDFGFAHLITPQS